MLKPNLTSMLLGATIFCAIYSAGSHNLLDSKAQAKDVQGFDNVIQTAEYIDMPIKHENYKGN